MAKLSRPAKATLESKEKVTKKIVVDADNSFDNFLVESGIRDEVYDSAYKRVIAWQFDKLRQKKAMTKKAMAEAMKTSRSQVDRVLDPNNIAVSIDMLERAAAALGKTLKIELVDA
jgi:DNA-binding Xre family transcriptional regulator